MHNFYGSDVICRKDTITEALTDSNGYPETMLVAIANCICIHS